MTDYFDASAIAALLFLEPVGERISGHLGSSGVETLVSDFVVAEVSSAVSRLVRMRERSNSEGRDLLQNLDDWVDAACDPIPVEPEDVHEATALVRDFTLKLRAPDALHLAICQRIDARLVTLDTNLADAARAVGVACINPAEISA